MAGREAVFRWTYRVVVGGAMHHSLSVSSHFVGLYACVKNGLVV